MNNIKFYFHNILYETTKKMLLGIVKLFHFPFHLRRLTFCIFEYFFLYIRGIFRLRIILSYRKQFIKDNQVKRNSNPLISVLIPTYNRGKILTERTIPSILNQTYPNIEIIIVGDHVIDNTSEIIAEKYSNNPKIIYKNLKKRGNYPKEKALLWMVQGSKPLNHALSLAKGEWIALLCDDDIYLREHIEKLVKFALIKSYDFVYPRCVSFSHKNYPNSILGYNPIQKGYVAISSIMFHKSLKHIKVDNQCWRYQMPWDWFQIGDIILSGAKIGFLKEITCLHTEEGLLSL